MKIQIILCTCISALIISSLQGMDTTAQSNKQFVQMALALLPPHLRGEKKTPQNSSTSQTQSSTSLQQTPHVDNNPVTLCEELNITIEQYGEIIRRGKWGWAPPQAFPLTKREEWLIGEWLVGDRKSNDILWLYFPDADAKQICQDFNVTEDGIERILAYYQKNIYLTEFEKIYKAHAAIQAANSKNNNKTIRAVNQPTSSNQSNIIAKPTKTKKARKKITIKQITNS